MIRLVVGLGFVFFASMAFAHVGLLEEVMIIGKKPKSVGDRTSANEGVILAQDINLLPLERTGDVLEFVPGMVATQHSGSGKANQYFLRGFNLDHGTDFSTRVDFMPVNMVSHGHGQGYTDLNFLIPELVSTINYRKGPYYADAGDFAGTGEALLHTARFLPSNIASVQSGSFGYRRGVIANQWEQGFGVWLLGAELQGYDGPWSNVDEDVGKKNLWLKYSTGGVQDGFDVSVMAYDNSWNSADQIPLRSFQADASAQFMTIDPSSGGESDRYSLAFQKRWHSAQSAWFANAYMIRYNMDLWSNFTYFTKAEGDQIYQADSRWVMGGDLANTRDSQFFAQKSSYTWGLQWRMDDIDSVGLFNTRQRDLVDVVREDVIDQQMLAVYWTGATQWSSRWTTTVSLRWNEHRFQVEPLNASLEQSLRGNGGDRSASLVTGGVRNRFFVNERSDLYINLGRGYHSNDARGVLTKIDPVSGESINPADPLVPVVGGEAGLNWQTQNKHWAASVALWALRVDSEQIFVGDAGTTENTEVPSKRSGVELTASYQPHVDWIVNGDYSYTHSALQDHSLSDQAIPGALKHVARVSMIKSWGSKWQSSIKWMYSGRYHLGDGEYAQSAQKLDLNTRYIADNGITWSVDVLNILDSTDSDIEYWYASQLFDEVAPINDRHIHPFVPRSLRVKLSYEY